MQSGVIRVGEVCHHWEIVRNGITLGGAEDKKTKKVSENYHKGIKSQILAFLSDSEARRTAGIVSEVDGARQKVSGALSELVKAGEIEKVKRGVYRGAPVASLIDEAKDGFPLMKVSDEA